jgi:hypothetical protein
MMALGAVVTLIGGAGIFAVFTDRATTGSSSVTSGERASAANLLIASSTGPPDCGTYVDDLVTDLITVTDAQPSGAQGTNRYICLKNAGSASLALSAAAIDLVDVETACTGDEAATGDASCGIVGGVPGTGELASVLIVQFVVSDCGLFERPTIDLPLADLEAGMPLGVPSLAPDEVVCLRLSILYPTTTPAAAQIAQTDQVTWRFAFDGTTTS